MSETKHKTVETSETNTNATTRSGFKNLAVTAGIATGAALTANAITAGAKAAYGWAKSEKKEQARAAFGGASGFLKLK